MALSRLIRVLRHRLRSLTHRAEVDTELDRELQYHLEALADEKIAQGQPPREAWRAARLEFGNVTAIAEASRDQRRVRWMDDLRQDVTYGWRMLRHSPGVTAVAVLSIAIGVGANAAVIGAIDRALVEGLPHAGAERLVFIDSTSTESAGGRRGISVNEFLTWSSGSRAFDAIDAILSGPAVLGGDAGEPARQVAAHRVTRGFFQTLDAAALVGRTFTFEESRLIDPVPAVIIGERLWRSRFGADPGVIGRTIRINRQPRTLVGVMPASFRFQNDAVDMWLPLRLLPSSDQRPGRPLRVIGRLAPGVSIDRAAEDLDRMGREIAVGFPVLLDGWRLRVRTLEEALLGWARQPLVMLQTGVALVWLIACANVAGLLLARGTVRRREIGMRLALGATRRRVVRQLLVETGLLAVLGGVLALAVAQLGLIGLTAVRPPLDSPALAPMRVDPTVFAAVLALSVASALVAGLAPALAASKSHPLAAARSSDGDAGSSARHGARSFLVTAQLALALALLVGAGLLTNSTLRKAWRDLNFDPEGVLTFDVPLPPDLRPAGTVGGFPYLEVGTSPAPAYADILDGLRALPGVTSAGGSSFPVVNSLIVPRFDVRIAAEPGAAGDGRRASLAAYYVVTPGLFDTLRTPILRGRDVLATDVESAPWVALVNDTAARRFWPEADALGQMIRLDTVPDDPPRRVVGVVANIPRGSGELEPEPIVYASYRQQPRRWRAPWRALFFEMSFVVRGDGDPRALVPGVRQLISSIDADLPLGRLNTFGAHLSAAVQRERELAALVVALGCVAAALAAMGIYGAVSHAVSRRRREIGIRKALGASSYRVAGVVARQAAVVVGAGVVLGVAAAVPLARLIEPQLWGIGPFDPLTYVAAAAGVSAVAVLACALPARRAMAVDPARTLHSE